MTQDFGEGHPLGQAMSGMKAPAPEGGGAIQEQGGRVIRISWEELRQESQDWIVDIKRTNPDLSEVEIEAVADLLFGPFRMDQKSFNRDESQEAKRIRASLQHNLVHGVLDAQGQGSSDEFTQGVYGTVALLDKLARTDPGKDSGLYHFVAGVRGELGVVKALMRGGYDVFSPDYMEDILEIPEGQDQVTRWDVNSGIDLVAQKPGDHMLLVDAKGEFRLFGQAVVDTKFATGTPRMSASVYLHPKLEPIPEDLRETIAGYKGRVKRTTIFAPTEEKLWPKLSPQRSPAGMKSALRAYGMPVHAEDAIIRQTRSIQF